MTQTNSIKNNAHDTANTRSRALIIFAILAVVWLIFDQITKAVFSAQLTAHSIEGLHGIIDFRLVHNVGAAWGLFGGAITGIVILTIVVCAAILIYVFKMAGRTSLVTVVGLSLVFAGGISNMIDRLMNGYVIDFIEFAFIDFPVFNIADIGVTCGVVLFLIGFISEWREEEKAEKTQNDNNGISDKSDKDAL